jgi:hypothetical protein
MIDSALDQKSLRSRLRLAGGLSVLVGLGFGLPGVYGAVHLAETGEVWTFMGFPTYGHGPFEDIGIETTLPLMIAYVAVCAAEVTCGVLLWKGRRSGVVMSVLLLPLELAFWSGFLLPYAFPLGIGRTALAVWPSRRAAAPA